MEGSTIASEVAWLANKVVAEGGPDFLTALERRQKVIFKVSSEVMLILAEADCVRVATVVLLTVELAAKWIRIAYNLNFFSSCLFTIIALESEIISGADTFDRWQSADQVFQWFEDFDMANYVDHCLLVEGLSFFWLLKLQFLAGELEPVVCAFFCDLLPTLCNLGLLSIEANILKK